jgi:hypothetical protein
MRYIYQLAIGVFVYGYVQLFFETRWQMQAHIEILKMNPKCDYEPEIYNAAATSLNSMWNVVTLGIFRGSIDMIRGIDHHSQDCLDYLKQIHRFALPNPCYVLRDYISSLIFAPIEELGQHLGVGLFNITKHHNIILQVILVIAMILVLVLLLIMQVKYSLFTRMTTKTRQSKYKSLKQV